MKLLSKNSKIKESQGKKLLIYNFGIPAFKSEDGLITCPNALNCVSGCYAKQGAYRFSNVKNAYEKRLQATFKLDFAAQIAKDLNKALKQATRQNKSLYIRIHDSGDFYNYEYLYKWLKIALAFKEVNFYAYTKQISMFNQLSRKLPENLKIIYSYGGKQDYLIDDKKDRHAKVFESKDQIPSDYIDASKNDLLALTENKKIALVYHGNKKYNKTNWKNVS